MVQQTLQIATFGQDKEGILSGIRNFPIHKLILLHYKDDTKAAEEFSRNLRSTLGVPMSLRMITSPDIIRSAMEHISDIIKKEGDQFQQILINVSAGDKMIGCAALSCAFINGIKAFGTDSEGKPMLLPIMKLSYNEIISDAKIKILQALDKAGGTIENLDELTKLTNLGKPLLSYHIQGNEESKGLVHLGLVDAERLERGKSRITLNTLGRMLISTK
ncbi:MAG: hypothetical protein EPO63_04315 [Candidatus Nitrosotenuis sp.]|nr:MAG: hypothetical protein EPO63_04315 [Candidatus Nitrosotenuis sp.]